jgi:hypothetical protein
MIGEAEAGLIRVQIPSVLGQLTLVAVCQLSFFILRTC